MSSYKDTTLAVQSYALALHGAAKKQDAVDAILADAQEIDKVLGAPRRRLRAVIESPQVTIQEKHDLIKKILGEEAHQLLRNLVALLIDRGRASLLGEILQAYEQLVERDQGILPATITTARPLATEEEVRLKAAAEKFTKRNLRVTFQVEPSLLGGVVFRFRDTLVDGSLRRRLRDIRERFEAAAA